MVDDVYIGAESEALQASNDTQRFGVESVGATDGFLEYAREDDFSIGGTSNSVRYSEKLVGVGACVPANFEGWRSHWREFCDYLEDAVKLALW